MPPLRIGIDARMETGVLGGVEQVVIGIADALSGLGDGDEEYLFLTTRGADGWIAPHLRGSCRAMPAGRAPLVPAARHTLRRLASRGPGRVSPPRMPPSPPPDVMASDGTIERAGVDVVHFLCQMAFLTDVPSIYHPHDLQHLHLPEMLPSRDVELRELWYRSFCEQASLVAIMTEWGKRDLVEQYGLPEEKIAVVPWGCVLDAYGEPTAEDLDRTRRELDLPERFLLFPGQTWAHKNHETLLEALALIERRHGAAPPLVCTGHPYAPHQGLLERRVGELGLDGTVRFAGFVEPIVLRCLYSLATALVFPSRFEGWGMPVTEAFAAGLPVACSNAAALPEVAGDAALLFDPGSPDEMAERIWALWSDEALRAELVRRGRERAERLSFERAARVFRAHYRRIAGRELSPADAELVAESLGRASAGGP